jgi:hypothetical protein
LKLTFDITQFLLQVLSRDLSLQIANLLRATEKYLHWATRLQLDRSYPRDPNLIAAKP